jgi:quinol monooxygenase YgiN
MKTESPPTPGVPAVPKLAIIGNIEVAPGQRRDLLTSLLAHKARCLKDEPGTLDFEVLAPHEDETKVLVYELYQSEAAFAVHRNGASIAQLRKEIAGLGIKLTVTRCALAE